MKLAFSPYFSGRNTYLHDSYIYTIFKKKLLIGTKNVYQTKKEAEYFIVNATVVFFTVPRTVSNRTH